jgi:hypothetical protein
MAIRKTTHGNTAPLTRSVTRPVTAEAGRLPAATGGQTRDPAPIVKLCPVIQAVALTRDLIAERAQTIWLKRGCPRDRDVENWREAETQLKIELGGA